jgi:hypothetical protein
MNSNQPSENDKPLRKVLSEWKVDATLPPRFQERVWERIKNSEGLKPSIWLLAWKRFLTRLTRPAFATAYMIIFLLVGVSAGCESSQSKTAHIKSDLQARYVQMVDPYKTPR